MKYFKALCVLMFVSGCGSSSDSTDSSDNELIGVWVSNCHELLGTEDENGNNAYNISQLTITESDYIDSYTSYSDVNCTLNPFEETSNATYLIGSNVDTTDGVQATRITLTAEIPERPELDTDFEGIYRVVGVELNFGQYTEGEVPTIDTRVTYIKQ